MKLATHLPTHATRPLPKQQPCPAPKSAIPATESRRGGQARKRAPGLRRQRGTAIVESVIVLTLLPIFMTGGMFFHRLYVAKHESMTEARGLAWVHAITGCAENLNTMKEVWEKSGSKPDEMDWDWNAKPPAMLNFRYTHHTVTKQVVSMTGSTLEGEEGTRQPMESVSSKTTLACNEVPYEDEGDLASVVKFVGKNLLPTLF